MASCRDTNMMMACLSLMVVMVGLMKGATAATEYVVGDSLEWTLPPNTSFYSDWAASKTFQIGDTITFKVAGNNSLAQATKEEYLNCSDPGLVFSSVGGNLTSSFPLISAGSSYFVCTVGDNCERGQKVNITVASGAHDTVAFMLLWLISSMLLISFTYM